MSSTDITEVGRFYTRARKVKKMLGKLHDGSKIPGGPYTLTQGAAGVFAGFLALNTNGLWTTRMSIADIVLGVLAMWGVAWAVGRLPSTNRNPALVLVDASGAVFKPAMGRYRGAPLEIRKPGPRPASCSRTAWTTVRNVAKPDPIPPTSVEPAATTAIETPKPDSLQLSGSAVQRLLAQVNTK
ncbi:hypothetical protein ASF98_18665 [Arthrobacter sp. Leaf337]|uniref:hypothetical protein n=1 Tax=Arthrobacter sp. Leaf337 TaxID=1736342 RepID=UPI0006FAE825|nr:hypothetical protein [Arthrobacter sp. Leaf337]KQR80318.1 hypothetical protein ASF98_18665 [Arthrobacter sp. Leaf337]